MRYFARRHLRLGHVCRPDTAAPTGSRVVEPATSSRWISLRPEPWASTDHRPQRSETFDLRRAEPVRGVSCIAFGLGANGAAWLRRVASSGWFSGLEPRPDNLAAARGGSPAGCLSVWPDASPDITVGVEAALARIDFPSAPLATVAVLGGAGAAEQKTVLSLVAALRERRDSRGCRMAVVVTLERPAAGEDAFERELVVRGAFVVRPGPGVGGDHFHHFPLRASGRPRRGRLVCVDLADYLASWRPGSRAELHVIPSALRPARDAVNRLVPSFERVGALNLDLHAYLDGQKNLLFDLDQLALHCRERFPEASEGNFVFTSSERLDGSTGTADLVVIEGACPCPRSDVV